MDQIMEYSEDFDNFTNETDAGGAEYDPTSSFLIYGLGITPIASLGVLGNFVSAVVLSRPQMRSSVSCLLLGLAFCDTLLISISILIFGLPAISDYTGTMHVYRYHFYPLWVPYLFPISITAQTGSVYLTLSVTIERYVAVCYSLHARSLCTWRRARACVAIVLLLACAYNAPRWFEVCVQETEFRLEDNSTIYENVMCPLRAWSSYKTYYINWSYLIVMYLIPFLGLVLLNWAIYQQVRRANRARQILSKLQRREMGLATMLLFVVGVFLLCNVLPLVNNILESFYDDMSLDALVQVSNFLVVFNSSVNFVIYCTCGERFRRLLVRIWKDCVLRCDPRPSARARRRHLQRQGHLGKFGSFRGSTAIGSRRMQRRATTTSTTCTLRLMDGDSSPSRWNTIVSLQDTSPRSRSPVPLEHEELPLHYSGPRSKSKTQGPRPGSKNARIRGNQNQLTVSTYRFANGNIDELLELEETSTSCSYSNGNGNLRSINGNGNGHRHENGTVMKNGGPLNEGT